MAQGRLIDFDHQKEWPTFLQAASKRAVLKAEDDWRPIVIDMSESGGAKQLEKLVASQVITRVIDNYDEQYAELLVSRQPQLYQASYEVKRASLEEYIVDHYAKKS